MKTIDPAQFVESLRSDFNFFVRAIWADRKLDRVAPLSDIEMDMSDFAANGPRLRGVLAARGYGKTTLITSCLACYRLVRDPKRIIIIVSKSTGEARKTLKLIRNWLSQIWFLKHLAPRNDQADNSDGFDIGTTFDVNTRQRQVSAFGAEGQLEGNRAHSIFPDDMETKANSKTREARGSLVRICGEFKNILFPHREHEDGGPIDPVEICYVGTPKHEETLYQNRIDAGYEFRSYPIACPLPSEDVIKLAPIIRNKISSGKLKPGDPILPLRFGLQEIAERQAEGYSEYARESMLIANLSATNRYPLRLRDLIVLPVDPERAPVYLSWGTQDHNGSTALDIPSMGFGDDCLHRPVMIDPQWAPYTHTVAWIDPAGRGSDHTGICILGYLNGFFWVKCLQSIPGGSSEADMITLCKLCRTHQANSVYIESNADTLNTYRPLFRTILNRHFTRQWKASFIEDTKITHSTHRKEERIINIIEPVASTHRLIIPANIITPTQGRDSNDEIQYQFTRMRNEPKALKEDAMIDSLAGAIRATAHALNHDPVKGLDHIRQDAITKQRIELNNKLSQLRTVGNTNPPSHRRFW